MDSPFIRVWSMGCRALRFQPLCESPRAAEEAAKKAREEYEAEPSPETQALEARFPVLRPASVIDRHPALAAFPFAAPERAANCGPGSGTDPTTVPVPEETGA